MTWKRMGLASLSAALFLLGSPASVSRAEPAPVSCGAIITTDTVLNSDVGPCSLGVVIGASNITFDLGGHRIFGRAGGRPGILVQGLSGVRIRNGTVSDFGAGVNLVGGQGNTVTAIQAINNIGSPGTFGYGIGVVMSFSNTVNGNRAARNGAGGGIALRGTFGPGVGPAGNVVQGNAVEDNDGPGVFLGGFARGNVVSGNRITGNSSDGIQLQFLTAANQITANVVVGNGFRASDRRGDGIFAGHDAFEGPTGGVLEGDQVDANTVFFNAANGIHVGSHNNQIRSNRTGNNNQLLDAAVPAFDLLDSTSGNACDANAWSGNTFVTAFPPCTTAP